MGLAGLFTVFALGYIIGVWTACVVLRRPQSAADDGAAARQSI